MYTSLLFGNIPDRGNIRQYRYPDSVFPYEVVSFKLLTNGTFSLKKLSLLILQPALIVGEKAARLPSGSFAECTTAPRKVQIIFAIIVVAGLQTEVYITFSMIVTAFMVGGHLIFLRLIAPAQKYSRDIMRPIKCMSIIELSTESHGL